MRFFGQRTVFSLSIVYLRSMYMLTDLLSPRSESELRPLRAKADSGMCANYDRIALQPFVQSQTFFRIMS